MSTVATPNVAVAGFTVGSGADAAAWAARFDCSAIHPLIVCRGPVRKEAMDTFAALGIARCGILVSDKDSIAQDTTGVPELRAPNIEVTPHSVSDYSGATANERAKRIEEIIALCERYSYDSVFAGYGFMAEDLQLVRALEKAGLRFIGPNSGVVYAAGFKDEAKRVASQANISVTPGVDQLTALTVFRAHPDIGSLRTLARQTKLKLDTQNWRAEDEPLRRIGEMLTSAQQQGVELFTIEELCREAVRQAEELFARYPKSRLRLKAVGGGGGKGQRIAQAPADYSGDAGSRVRKAAEPVASMVRDILSEAKATGASDNRNVLLELNIEQIRHQEIQMVGNGDWFLCMGGRDCSIQMHEQKLLEFSVTAESLAAAEHGAVASGKQEEAQRLATDAAILQTMEAEAERFAQHVGLNSVSTFECIVAGAEHYFMEVNTRIQVEHRVSELCYVLRFADPDNPETFFEIDSLVALMVLLAVHGADTPKPRRAPAAGAALEVRLNATNAALQPHAGGLIDHWSSPAVDEIRDDQGLGDRHPVSGRFLPYRLTGYYDSNIALLLCRGDDRADTLRRMGDILTQTVLAGVDLETNLNFHRGLIYWLLGQHPEARPSTAFTPAYLVALARLARQTALLDIDQLWSLFARDYVARDSQYPSILAAKCNLLTRPLKILLACPHLLSGWLSYRRNDYHAGKGRFSVAGNPLLLLRDLYRYLGLGEEDRPGAITPRIWSEDAVLLRDALSFYQALSDKLAVRDYAELESLLADKNPPKTFNRPLWERVRGAHRAHSGITEILALPAALAQAVDFYALGIEADLSERIPDDLRDVKAQKEALSVLAPAPARGADELVAPSGGMFYRREIPTAPPLAEVGHHFNQGDAVCVIEVMKMFNKVHAPFSGVVKEVLAGEDGNVVKKGQPLFKVEPDKAHQEQPTGPSERERTLYTETIYNQLKETV